MLFIDICTFVFSAQFQHVFREIPTVWYDIDNKTVISFQKQYPKEILNFGSLCLIQGVRGQSGFFNWALRERNIQIRLYLKVVLKS